MKNKITVKDESFPWIADELLDTFVNHYKEAESKREKKIKANFNVPKIKELIVSGAMKGFIARDEENNIVGYSFVLLTESDLFTGTPSSSNVALFVSKKFRKNGVMEKIIRFQDDILKKMNIHTSFCALKEYHGKKKMEKLGYEFVERSFQKVLI